MSEWAIRDIEIGVVKWVKITSATFVDSVKNVRPDGTSKDWDFVFNINIMICFCERNKSVNNLCQASQPPSSSSSPIKKRREVKSTSMFFIVVRVFSAFFSFHDKPIAKK